MPPLSFRQLERQLRAAGVHPAVVCRTVQELRDHYADAEADGLERGLTRREARRAALGSLGSTDSIVAEVCSRRELMSWRYRWPRSARCVDSLSYCCVLPAASFLYCASHRASITRWGLSSSLALCLTATLLFALRWLYGPLP
jgi:hypothetical protein